MNPDLYPAFSSERAYNVDYRPVGQISVLAAAQDDGIARFYAQSDNIAGHVGASFVYNADHTERHGYFHYLKARVIDPAGQHFTYRIVQRDELINPLAYLGDPLFVQAKPFLSYVRANQSAFFISVSFAARFYPIPFLPHRI